MKELKAFRLPGDLIAEVEKYRVATEKKTGMEVSFTQAVISLIKRGLRKIRGS